MVQYYYSRRQRCVRKPGQFHPVIGRALLRLRVQLLMHKRVLQWAVDWDVFQRPAYAYGIYNAAVLASKLDIKAITCIEFGVGTGTGLLLMQKYSKLIGQTLGVEINVVGFDSGLGLPTPVDYRDMPHVWGTGMFNFDQDKLMSKLSRKVTMVMGDVRRTVSEFLVTDYAPIGFVSFDLDQYSGTKAALSILATGRTLPRTYCYFDDVIWPDWACYNDYAGELLAIREFNCSTNNDKKHIAKIPHLAYLRKRRNVWNEQMYVCHSFKDPLYTKYVSDFK